MQCPECHKFPAFDDSTDPEISDLEVDDDGNISGSVRIVLTCAEDSTELKESTFDIQTAVSDDFAAAHKGEGHELSVEEGSFSLDSRQESQVIPLGYHPFEKPPKGSKKPDRCIHTIRLVGTAAEPGDPENKVCDKKEKAGVHKIRHIPFRYQKRFYGYSGDATVECSCGGSETVSLQDEVQASGMEEMT
jgi:hypothetical protein